MAEQIGRETYKQWANDAATANGVDPVLFSALIQSESSWNPNAVNTNSNGTTDYGIAQLNSRYFPTAQNMTVKEQLEAAAKHLKEKIAAAGGDLFQGVRGYKGSGAVATQNAANVFKIAGYTVPDGIAPNGVIVDGASSTGGSQIGGIGGQVANFFYQFGVPIAIVVAAFGIGWFSLSGALAPKGN